MKKVILLTLIPIFSVGCSTVQTQKSNISLSSINGAESFQLLVQTGNPIMDKLVYEMVYLQFSGVLPLKEKEPFTGVMEITFASADQSAFIGGTSTINNVSSGWYTKSGYTGGTSTTHGNSYTSSSGSTLTWQNSTMMIVLKKSTGERLWTADYNYKGGWEMSGWVVNTPNEAARLVTQRLREQFDVDFQK